jgi:2'-5' RNA ligase
MLFLFSSQVLICGPDYFMNNLRAFIAIEIPTAIKEAIAKLSAGLQTAAGQTVRWVSPANTHLTLKFIGEIPPAAVDTLAHMLQLECRSQPAFEISVSRAGCFPNSQRPRIIWVGLQSPHDLVQLQQRIEAGAARLGIAPEDRPFSPHLSIGRVRPQLTAEQQQTLQTSLIALPQVTELGKFTVRSVTLFKSELRPAGALYTTLFNARLGG